MQLKLHELTYDNKRAMIMGVDHAGGIYKTEEAKRIVKCVNFFSNIPQEKLNKVMVELAEYYKGLE